MQSTYNGLTFSDSDVVNPNDFVPEGDFNPHNVRPFALYCAEGIIGVAFADCEEDAIDEVVDAGKMDGRQITPEEYDAMTEDEQSEYMFAGNASDIFCQTDLRIMELPHVPFSFCAMFNAGTEGAQ